MKLYMVEKWSDRITEYEIDRMNANSVWINGVRSAKISEHERFFGNYGAEFALPWEDLRLEETADPPEKPKSLIQSVEV